MGERRGRPGRRIESEVFVGRFRPGRRRRRQGREVFVGRSATSTRPSRNYVVGGDSAAAEPSNTLGDACSMMAFFGVYYGILEWTQRRRNVYQEKLDAWKNLTRAIERD